MDEILEITLLVAGTFDKLDVPYLIGGSLASSLHGIPRATQDVDLVAGVQREHVSALIDAWRGTFYLDEAAIRDAVEQHTSFNLIHLCTLFKVDVFVAKNDEVSRQQMQRRQRFAAGDAAPRELTVASAEDVVAQKLYWYRLGDEVSERQWTDAVGVLKVGGDHLDLRYLRFVAGMLGVEDFCLPA